MRPSVIYGWLRSLKAVNPLYKDIEITDTEEHVLALQRISDRLVKQFTLLDNQILEDMENIIEQRTESSADESMNIEKDLEPHVENLEEVIPINNVFITNTSYVDGGSENPLTSVCLALKNNFRIDQ